MSHTLKFYVIWLLPTTTHHTIDPSTFEGCELKTLVKNDSLQVSFSHGLRFEDHNSFIFF